MISSPFPGMNPYLEVNPTWQVFHGWFIRKLAEFNMQPARELGCQIDVERSVYGREPNGELVLIGEPDALVERDPAAPRFEPRNGGTAVALAQPQAIHEIVLDPDELQPHKQEYMVVREGGQSASVLAVVELLSFANKDGSYVPKYREKRSRFLASGAHFLEIDFLRAGENPSRDLFPELPRTAYFIFIARKTGCGRIDEGYPLRLPDPLPVVGLPLGPGRPDLPLDLAAAFRSAYDLSYRANWFRYDHDPVPAPPLPPEDQAWVEQRLKHVRAT